MTNGALFATAPAIDGTNVTFTPADNGNGTATFILTGTDTGSDEGDSDNDTTLVVTVTVTAANDDPSFTASDQTVLEDAGAQVVAEGDWLSGISDGDPFATPEDDQAITFAITGNTNTGLFSSAPAVTTGASVTETCITDWGHCHYPDFFINLGTCSVSDPGLATCSGGPLGGGTYPYSGCSMGGFDDTCTLDIALGDATQLSYTPAADANGSATITVTATDDNGTPSIPGDDKTHDETFTITVSAINDAPSFVFANPTVLEDSGAASIAITSINTGPANESGQTMTFYAGESSNPDLFSAAPAIDGTNVTFTPAAHAHGTATFDLTGVDSGPGDFECCGGRAALPPPVSDENHTVLSVTITVTSVDDPEVAIADSYIVDIDDDPTNEPDTNLTVPNEIDDGVLKNDSDADVDGDELTVTGNTIPTSGFVGMFPDGSFVYDAVPGFTGTAMFDYTMTDSEGPPADSTARVTLTINVPAARVDADPIDYVTNMNTDLEIPFAELVAEFNDTVDEVPDTVTFDSVGDPGDGDGTTDAVDSVVTYSPAEDFIGTATFTITVTDGRLTTDETVTVRVNRAPDTVDDAYSVDEDGSVVIDPADLISDDTDTADAVTDTVTFVGIDDGSTHGTLTLDAGKYTYEPDDNYFGSDSFDYEVTDGVLNSIGTVNLTVDAVNDKPSFTFANPTVLEDSLAASLSITGTSAGPGNEIQTVSFGISALTNATLFATAPAIDGTNVTFTPAADANGAATFVLTGTDTGGTPNGGDDDDAITVTVNVTAVNDAPTVSVESTLPTSDEDDGVTTWSLADWSDGLPADGDPELSQTLSYTVGTVFDSTVSFTTPPAIDLSAGEITFTVADNDNGSFTIPVKVTDSGVDTPVPNDNNTTVNVVVTVDPVNDEPSFTFADPTVAEDSGAASLPITGIDAGPNEPRQTVGFAISGLTNGGLFDAAPAIDGTEITFTPADDAEGTATFLLTGTDDGGTPGDDNDAITVTVTVTEVNDKPVFTLPGDPDQVIEDIETVTVPGFYTLEGPGGGTDEAGQALTRTVTHTNPSLFSVAPAIDGSGTLTYETAEDAIGTSVVSVSLTDDGTTNGSSDPKTKTDTFNITVTDVNDAPVFTLVASPDQTVAEDSGVQTVAGFYTDAGPGGGPDEAGQSLTLTVTTTNGAIFSAAPSIDIDGMLGYEAADDANGTATVTVSLTDNGTTDGLPDPQTTTQTFTITVTPVNDGPVAVDDTYETEQHASLAVSAAGGVLLVGDDDFDIDGDTISVVAGTVTTAEGVTFVLDGDGSFTYTPPTYLYGTDTFDYTITDGALTSTATVTIEIERGLSCTEPGPTPFTDVPAGAFYEAAVEWALACGVTTGTSATTFSGTATVTRGQFVTFLWRAAGEPSVVEGPLPFTDVSPSAFYYDAVRWAHAEGITTGTSVTTFSPGVAVDRAQAVTLLHRFSGSPAPAGSEPFVDVAPGQYFYDAVRWAVESGITFGTGPTTFSPYTPTTRAQAVAFLYRATA